MITPAILDFLAKPILTLVGGVWGLLAVAIAFFAKNYLVPFLAVEKHRRYAEWIAHIADEVTDDLVSRYPNREWIKFIDESVDKIMEICGIDEDTARRAVEAASARKTSCGQAS